jgi:hypothetical protein
MEERSDADLLLSTLYYPVRAVCVTLITSYWQVSCIELIELHDFSLRSMCVIGHQSSSIRLSAMSISPNLIAEAISNAATLHILTVRHARISSGTHSLLSSTYH